MTLWYEIWPVVKAAVVAAATICTAAIFCYCAAMFTGSAPHPLASPHPACLAHCEALFDVDHRPAGWVVINPDPCTCGVVVEVSDE